MANDLSHYISGNSPGGWPTNPQIAPMNADSTKSLGGTRRALVENAACAYIVGMGIQDM
jgi:hypothetical protein